MNAADAGHCSGCGRDLGLEPIARDGALQCPDCRVAMSAFDCGPGALHDCGRCGGQFAEHAALRDLIERHDRLDVGVRGRAITWRPESRVRYVACPVCASMMNRRNFGGGSGVIVDVCAKHGTWFDAGELPRVLSFVESGGLTRIRRRNEEERERLAHERVSKGVGSEALRIAADRDEPAMSARDIITDLLRDLFG